MKSYAYFHDDLVDLLDYYCFDFNLDWRDEDAEKSEVAHNVGAAIMALRQLAYDATMRTVWSASNGGDYQSDAQLLRSIIQVDIIVKAGELFGNKDFRSLSQDEARTLASAVRDAAAAWAATHFDEALEIAVDSAERVLAIKRRGAEPCLSNQDGAMP